jgi:PKD repeat protein
VVAGTNVSFSGTASDAGGLGTITSTAWDFDHDGVTFDSDTTGTLTPAHTYATPGTYLVALQATDASGNTGMDVTSVVVTGAGALIVTAGPDQSVTVGDSVSFSGSYSYPAGSVSSSGLAWDFDYDGVTFDSDTTATLTPSHTFTAEGTYQVALQVTADDGTYNLSVLEVQADYNYSGPSADAGSDQTIDQGETVYFTGDYSEGDGTVDTTGLEWDFDYDGYLFEADTSGSTSPSLQYLASGTYDVAFRVTDENGLSSLDTMQVTVNNVAPSVSLSGGGTITVGDSASFTATVSDPGGSADPVNLYWDFAYDGSTFVTGGASGLTVTHTFVSQGDYTVAVLAVDSAGDSSLATVSVTVNDNQGVVVIDAGPDQAVNQGDAVDFDGSSSDPQSILTSTIEWDFDYDGTTFNAESSASGTLTPTFTFSTPGLHLVALAIQDTSSNWHLGTLYVDVANLPPEVDPGADLTGEEGTAVDFDGTVTDPGGPDDLDDIDWDFNYDGMTFNAEPSASGVLDPSYTYASAGDYLVALRASDLWGAVTIETLHVSISAVAPDAIVSNSGPADEGSPVEFYVDMQNGEPGDSYTFWASWDTGEDFELIDPEDISGSSGSYTITHTFDDNSDGSGFEVTLRIVDSDHASGDFTSTVVVNNVAPSGSLGASGGGTLVGPGEPIVFGPVSDPSYADQATGFTYWYSINGGDYQDSPFPSFLLPDYTANTSYTIDGYIEDKDGGTSDVYEIQVTTAAGWTILANNGNGAIELLNESVTIGAGEYYLYAGTDSGLDVVLLDDEADYELYTNGSFELIEADTGVGSVDVSVFTDVTDSVFVSGLSAHTGSATWTTDLGFYGTGDIDDIFLPAGSSGTRSSVLTLSVRGDLGSVTGPTGSGKLWAEAADLYFGNLTGSITGLDQIATLAARGTIGDDAADEVWANAGIGILQAFGIQAQVVADSNYNQSDLATLLTVGQGGIDGVVDLGTVLGATVGGSINQLKIKMLRGDFLHTGPGNITLLALGGTAPGAGGQAPKLESIDDPGSVSQVFTKDTAYSYIKVGGELRLKVNGSLKVTGNIQAGKIIGLEVSKDLTAKNILVTKGGIEVVGLDVVGNLTVAEKIQVKGRIDTIRVQKTLKAGQIVSLESFINALDIHGDLISSISAQESITSIGIGGNFRVSATPLLDAGKPVLVRAKTIESIDVQKDIGDKATKPADAAKIMAESIKRIKVGTFDVPDGGNLYGHVIATKGGIESIKSLGLIQGTIRAKGGNILFVGAIELNGAITAERLSATDNTGGSIGALTFVRATGTVHADNYIGKIEILSDRKSSTLKVTAQSGAKVGAFGVFDLAGGQIVQEALKLITGKAFNGEVRFTYGTARSDFRVQFSNGNELLTYTVGKVTQTWKVKKMAGMETKVTIQNALFKGDPLALEKGMKAVKPGGDVETTDWSVEK